jgi:hypothetical protein
MSWGAVFFFFSSRVPIHSTPLAPDSRPIKIKKKGLVSGLHQSGIITNRQVVA